MHKLALFLFLACVVAVYSISPYQIDFENIQYPLDDETHQLVVKSNLVTNLPDVDKVAPFVYTPFGIFGRECVHGTETGARVSEKDNGDLLVELENGTSYVYPSSKHRCQERFNAERVKARRQRAVKPAPLDGWLDNGWFFDTVELGSFTANYTVPITPPNPTGQVLFWFIGLECQDSLLAILQPVLTFNNIVTGWSFASWYCCPTGVPNYATPVQGFTSGAVLPGTIVANSKIGTPDFTVNSCFGKSCSTLNCPSMGRNYTYGDTTLETYSVQTCNQFAPGPMKFTNMFLTTLSGARYLPQWQQVTGPTECGGSITFTGETICTIVHTAS